MNMQFFRKLKITILIGGVFLGSLNSCFKRSKKSEYTESQLRGLKGIQVSTTGFETVFKVPLFQLNSDDKKILFDLIISSYVDSMHDLKEDFEKNKAGARGLEKLDKVTQYSDKIRSLVEKLVDEMSANKTFSDKLVKSVGEKGIHPGIYNSFDRQNMADTYLIPQLVAVYLGVDTKIAPAVGPIISWGVGLMFVVQAFMEVVIDNHTKKEKVNEKGETKRKPSLDAAIYVVPSGGAGIGAGAATSLDWGIGFAVGPIDNTHALGKYVGTRVKAEFEFFPVGLNVKAFLMGAKSRPPLFFFLSGFSQAAGAAAAATIAPTAFMDPYGYMLWVKEKLGMEVFKDADAVAKMAEKSAAAKEKGEILDLSKEKFEISVPGDSLNITD